MKVLLIADVGTNATGFYHIGDEAMVYETIQWYRQQQPKVQLGVLSRSISHQAWPVSESLHLPFPSADAWLASQEYCLSLITRVLLKEWFGFSVLKKSESQFIDTVSEYDVWQFTGGGNIYSHHAPWLYYVFFLLFLGKHLRKKVWLVSQTIGPFNWIDGMLARFFLGLSDRIILRGSEGLDAAYDLQPLPKKILPKKPSTVFRIGLSLHDWQDFGEALQQVIVAALNTLAKTHQIELIMLPHVFTRDANSWDAGYLQALGEKLSSTIKLVQFSYQQLMETTEPAVFIKTVTAEVDVMIATRYHALVFALSSNVPVLTFKLDSYYDQKNLQLLQQVYGAHWQRFVVALDTTAVSQLIDKLTALQQIPQVEKTLLAAQNKLLRQKTQSSHFETLLKQLTAETN